uniref:Transmembrane protein 64 n=1 Tax=Phallusia mammillata TaxID=59560 RepID=A0A6F9DVB2_9ASCI|nr:transmembrane protein 64 [Phallusia mammillata]
MIDFVKSRIRDGCNGTENRVLLLRGKLSLALQNICQKLSRQPASTDVEGQAYERPSFCGAYAAEYNGSTCVTQLCQRQVQTCRSCTCSTMDCTKSTIGCIINILCYPFIPCAVAFLPATCQNSTYASSNTLHCCYGGTACQSATSGGFCACCRTQQCCLIWISILITVVCLILWSFTQDSELLIQILLFLNDLGQATLLCFFVLFFTIVSFPMAWGYLPLNLAAGYLYGFLPAVPVVIISVTIGISTSHVICKKYFSSWVLGTLQQRSNFDQIEAILKVIDGSSGFKVIALTRLTPIPFGFQNGLFAVSNMNLFRYLLASSIGLLPTQVLNCYIGSTFRSMQELINQENPGGMVSFLIQIAIGIFLMLFVLRQARKELANALNNSPKPGFVDENVDSTADILTDVKVTQPISSASPHDSASDETT